MARRKRFDLARIASATGLTENQVARSKISKETLEEIYNDYQANCSMLEKLQKNIMDELNQDVMPHCHSIRSRIKDPDHLIAKIIRNAEEKGGKYSTIDSDNYLCRINDLIGIRVIVLRQKDSKAVHNAILSLYENDTSKYVTKECSYDQNLKQYKDCKSYIAEQPVVYVTFENDRKFYEDVEGLAIEASKRQYRSIHYIVRKGDIYFEIQVRTLFEEGWLEFDHAIKYPNDNKNPKKAEYLQILNCLALAADGLISFYDTVEPFMNEKKSNGNDKDNDNDAQEKMRSIEQKDGKTNKKLGDKIIDAF